LPRGSQKCFKDYGPLFNVQDVGGGIRVATVTDPFGNVLGVIEKPHFSLEATK
jgi:hypothetical protein